MERIPVKTKDTAHRQLADEALVVNFRSSFFYSFNPVGAQIWERCDGQHSVAQIAAELAEEYDVTLEEATRDCQEFIDGLAAEGLLEWRDG
jgi:pyrroloquinoline quinone biosynthesis protein D